MVHSPSFRLVARDCEVIVAPPGSLVPTVFFFYSSLFDLHGSITLVIVRSRHRSRLAAIAITPSAASLASRVLANSRTRPRIPHFPFQTHFRTHT